MVFLVIDKNSVNKIFTNYDSNIDIDMIEFETKEEAEYYLEYGILMQKNDEIIVLQMVHVVRMVQQMQKQVLVFTLAKTTNEMFQGKLLENKPIILLNYLL